MSFREKDHLDFELEKFIELFDMALTSNDVRLKKALGHLLTITALVYNESIEKDKLGPLKRLFNEHRDLIRRIETIEKDINSLNKLGKHPTDPHLDNHKNNFYSYIKYSSTANGEDC